MKICDMCEQPKEATSKLGVVSRDTDTFYDLCDEHMQEVIEFVHAPKKPKRKVLGRKKKAA